MSTDFKSVNKAFSKQAPAYDKEDAENDVLKWMRLVVINHVHSYLRKGDRMLELNAGTGLDAMYFSMNGNEVYATDLSDGMVKEIRKKVMNYNLHATLKVQQCSYTELQNIEGAPFDYVFSNFGGLNCVDDLRKVTKYLPSLLNKGAYVTWVIMPPVCPWELALIFKGNFRRAFRRFKRKGDLAHLEGEHFMTYYFTPSQVMKALGPEFKKIKLEGLASFSPPPHKGSFPKKYPGLYTILTGLDEKFKSVFPFNRWADHFILTVQYNGDKVS